MKAPHEVWGIPISGREGSWVLTVDKRVGSTVRYLRADLTCGDCEYGEGPCSAKKQTVYNPHPSDPACMEFVPKEER